MAGPAQSEADILYKSLKVMTCDEYMHFVTRINITQCINYKLSILGNLTQDSLF